MLKKNLNMKMSEFEYSDLKETARSNFLTISGYIRKCISLSRKKTTALEIIRKLCFEISVIKKIISQYINENLTDYDQLEILKYHSILERKMTEILKILKTKNLTKPAMTALASNKKAMNINDKSLAKLIHYSNYFRLRSVDFENKKYLVTMLNDIRRNRKVDITRYFAWIENTPLTVVNTGNDQIIQEFENHFVFQKKTDSSSRYLYEFKLRFRATEEKIGEEKLKMVNDFIELYPDIFRDRLTIIYIRDNDAFLIVSTYDYVSQQRLFFSPGYDFEKKLENMWIAVMNENYESQLF